RPGRQSPTSWSGVARKLAPSPSPRRTPSRTDPPDRRAVATPIGFEPTISTLTGWRVKPGYTTGPRGSRSYLTRRRLYVESPSCRSEEHTSELQSLTNL